MHSELSLMFGLMDRIPLGVDPMLSDLENYITQNGIDDMKACAEIITTVSPTPSFSLSLSSSLALSLSFSLSFPHSSLSPYFYSSHLFLQDSEKYVEELLSLFNRFSKLVEEAFHNDSRFLTARDKVNLILYAYQEKIFAIFTTCSHWQ